MQTICKHLYGHEYLLIPPERHSYSSENGDPMPKKSKVRVSSTEFEHFSYVLPPARIISKCRYLKLRDVANAILSKKVDVKGTLLQYDTTSRNKIEGEWPATIFKLFDHMGTRRGSKMHISLSRKAF